VQDNISLHIGRVGVLADRKQKSTRKTGIKEP